MIQGKNISRISWITSHLENSLSKTVPFTHAMNPSLGFSIVSFCPHAPGFLELFLKRLHWGGAGPRSVFLFAPRPHWLSLPTSLDHTFHNSYSSSQRSSFLNSLSFLPTLYKCVCLLHLCFQLYSFIGFLFLNLDYPSSFSSHPTAFPNTCTSVSPLGIPSHCWLKHLDSPDSPLLINRHLHALSIPVPPLFPSSFACSPLSWWNSKTDHDSQLPNPKVYF